MHPDRMTEDARSAEIERDGAMEDEKRRERDGDEEQRADPCGSTNDVIGTRYRERQ